MTALRVFDPDDDKLPSRPTVEQIVTIYLAHGTKGQSARALTERRRILDLFCASFGARFWDQIKPAEVVLWSHSHEGWKSDWTIRRVYMTLQRPFNWAERMGLLDRNPLRYLSHQPGDRGDVMDEKTYRQILGASDANFRRAVVFLAFTGCRPGEMSALEWSFIDWKRNAAILLKHKTSKSRRDHAPRTIMLHPVVLAMLRWMKKRRPEDRFVFTNALGEPWTRNSLSLRMQRIKRKLGLSQKVRLYGLRHRFGTLLAKMGVSQKTSAELMGHSGTRMTEHYQHLAGDIDHLNDAILKAFDPKKKKPKPS